MQDVVEDKVITVHISEHTAHYLDYIKLGQGFRSRKEALAYCVKVTTQVHPEHLPEGVRHA